MFVGKTAARYYVHRDLLCRYRYLQGQQDQTQNSSACLEIVEDSIEPDAFDIIVSWLYTGKAQRHSSEQVLEVLIKAWAWSVRSGMDDCANAIMDNIQDHFRIKNAHMPQSRAWLTPSTILQIGKLNLPAHSPLRRFVVQRLLWDMFAVSYNSFRDRDTLRMLWLLDGDPMADLRRDFYRMQADPARLVVDPAEETGCRYHLHNEMELGQSHNEVPSSDSSAEPHETETVQQLPTPPAEEANEATKADLLTSPVIVKSDPLKDKPKKRTLRISSISSSTEDPPSPKSPSANEIIVSPRSLRSSRQMSTVSARSVGPDLEQQRSSSRSRSIRSEVLCGRCSKAGFRGCLCNARGPMSTTSTGTKSGRNLPCFRCGLTGHGSYRCPNVHVQIMNYGIHSPPSRFV